jgi:hypothetical protein
MANLITLIIKIIHRKRPPRGPLVLSFRPDSTENKKPAVHTAGVRARSLGAVGWHPFFP